MGHVCDEIVSNDKESKSHATCTGKESHRKMVENDKLGDACAAERCFVFTGAEEQSLMFCALKQLVDLERMVRFQNIFR